MISYDFCFLLVDTSLINVREILRNQVFKLIIKICQKSGDFIIKIYQNFFLDVCEQAIFINNSRTVFAKQEKEVSIDIGNVMKIVGFSIQGISKPTNFTPKYSSSDSKDDLQPVYQTIGNLTLRVRYE